MQILLAIDGSPKSIEAAKFICRLPLPRPLSMTLVSVLHDDPLPLVNTQASVKRREAERKHIEESLQTVEKLLQPCGIQPRVELLSGHPKRNILTLAKSLNVDLIVLGDHGHSAIARKLLGSTSDYVVNHAGCSVLVVRAPKPGQEQEPDAGFQTLLAYDGSVGSQQAAAELLELEWDERAAIRVAMMLERPTLIPDDSVYDPPGVSNAEKAAADLIGGPLCSQTSAKIDYVVREAIHIGNGLTGLLNEQHFDMVCVGGTGKSEISKFFLGCVSRYVLHHADCSVWVARRQEWH